MAEETKEQAQQNTTSEQSAQPEMTKAEKVAILSQICRTVFQIVCIRWVAKDPMTVERYNKEGTERGIPPELLNIVLDTLVQANLVKIGEDQTILPVREVEAMITTMEYLSKES